MTTLNHNLLTPYWDRLNSLFIPDTALMPQRRHDLDWLRVIVFGLLLFYHIGMFYTKNWGWHIKSSHSSELLESIMLFVEPWRMPILWLIAGVAIRFILAKVTVWRFIYMRSLRLLLPLLFGILVIVPPQLYIEMSVNDQLDINYWQFLKVFFYLENTDIFNKYPHGIWPHIDVNHLWFLRSLWQYSLGLLIIAPLLNSRIVSNKINFLFRQNIIIFTTVLLVPVFVIQLMWPSETNRYPIGFTFLLYGYLIGWQPNFWKTIVENSSHLLKLSCFCLVCLFVFYNVFWIDVFNGGTLSTTTMTIGMFIYSLMRILGVLTVLAYGYKFLNRPSAKLRYLTDAVYPYYITHQTFIVIWGFILNQYNLGAVFEPLLLILLTILSVIISYEVIRKVSILRPFFGLTITKSFSPALTNFGYAASVILIFPLAWRLL